jgi:hypothetical protein
MTTLTIEDLQKVHDSLYECLPDEEQYQWGPTYEFAMRRREVALEILRRATAEARNNTCVPTR